MSRSYLDCGAKNEKSNNGKVMYARLLRTAELTRVSTSVVFRHLEKLDLVKHLYYLDEHTGPMLVPSIKTRLWGV